MGLWDGNIHRYEQGFPPAEAGSQQANFGPFQPKAVAHEDVQG